MDKNKRKKRCPKCLTTKSIKEFYKDKNRKGGYSSWCKLCQDLNLKEWIKRNKNKKALIQRKYELKHNYNITLEQYSKLLKKQNYECAICKRHRSKFKKRFAVDHNHKSKFVRGLLCHFCNSFLLRYLRDNKHNTIGMVTYLSKALKKDKGWT